MKQFAGLIAFTLIIFNCIVGCNLKEPKPKVSQFSFHLFTEPMHLDPTRSRASNSSYFFYNVLRGLYKINGNNELESEGGRCQWSHSKLLVCKIENQKWSDGSIVTAEDYKRSFLQLADPNEASPRSHLLTNIVNAREIAMGLKELSSLAIKITSPQQFEITFAKEDTEFLYKLASTALFPTHSSNITNRKDYKKFIGNGPYKIKKWNSGTNLILEPNLHFLKGHKDRPSVVVHFIEDEMTAYRLYQSGTLQFLRRIPSKLFHKVLNHKEFYQIPMLRFDYIGFGGKLKDQFNLRAALSHSINYEVLKKLLFALERPGCPSIPKTWMMDQPCLDFDLDKAKEFLLKVPDKIKNQVFDLKVSQQGGNDIKEQAEFLENQWKTHLGLKIRVTQVEGKVLLNELRKNPPDIFRKGVGLDRPTCISALETFSEDSKQNFIDIKNQNFNDYINQLKKTSTNEENKKTCQKANEYLLNNYFTIPLGEMHFGMMAKDSFTGWTINGMNQLDLSQLRPTTKK